MTTARVATLPSSATHLMASSSARGMSITTNAATAGTRIVSVSAHESNQFIEVMSLRSREDPQRESEHAHREDQDQGVELQPAGLHAAHRATGLAGDGRQAVDGRVDTALVHVVVRQAAERDRAAA